MTGIKRVFIDTNIWVYAFISEKNGEDKNAVILNFLENALKQNIIITSIQCINEFHSVLNKKYDISENIIKKYITGILEISEVLPLNLDNYLNAYDIRKRFKFSFWDSLIVSVAISGKASLIYTEDFKNNLVLNLNSEDKLQIINPLKL